VQPAARQRRSVDFDHPEAGPKVGSLRRLVTGRIIDFSLSDKEKRRFLEKMPIAKEAFQA
jgi:hypothetical protein